MIDLPDLSFILTGMAEENPCHNALSWLGWTAAHTEVTGYPKASDSQTYPTQTQEMLARFAATCLHVGLGLSKCLNGVIPKNLAHQVRVQLLPTQRQIDGLRKAG